ncbi:MAG TPA: nuclear transport factor 2 family protein [Jatrophihabitantaceae bacterium]|nr:nuclear transport factor 2 family protein [Jatrophihabitantaceae bacterium]
MDHDVLEDIRQLKYRYLRALDLKLWDEFADTLTEDVQTNYGAHLTVDGRDKVVDFMRASLGPAIITVHQVHHPEITVDGDTATGRWYLEDKVIVTEQRMLLTGACFYEDEYRRGADGAWRISKTGYVRSYEAVQSLDDTPSWKLTANRWASE